MKKSICTLLCIMLTVMAFMPVSSALASSTAQAGADDLLATIGVDVKIENPEAVTRSEFLYILMQLLNATASDNAEIPFKDISSYDYYYPIVKYAVDSGIISSAERFYPNEPIKFRDACKMLVSALGMDFVASGNGGYPTGYLVAAQRCDLTDGIENTDSMTRTSVMQLFDRFLVTNAYSVTGISGSEPAYSIMESDRTILSIYHDTEVISGIVTAVPCTGLYDGDASCDTGMLEVDDVLYRCSFSAETYIGKKVDVYVKDGDTVIYIKETDNQTLTVKASDISDVSGSRITFSMDDRDRSITLDSAPTVIYNGKTDKNYKLSDIMSFGGYVTFINNDTDGGYDAVAVWKYRVMIAESIDTVGKVIFGKNSTALKYDNSDYFYSFEKDGISTDASAIAAGNLLQIYESADGSVVSVKIVTDTGVNGTISGVDSSNRLLYIDDTAYEYTPDFESDSLAQFSIGDSVTAALTDDGLIAWAERSDASGAMWGFVTGVKKGTGLDTSVSLKMFTSGGKVEILSLADKITCDGNGIKKEDFITFYNENTALFDGLISYALNADGAINLIDTPNRVGAVSNSLPSDNRTSLFQKPDAIGSTLWYIRGTGMFAGCCRIADAKIFIISPDESLDDEQRFTLVDTTYFVRNTGYTPGNVQIYNVDEFGQAEAVLIFDRVSKEIDAETTAYGIVSSVTRSINENGEEGVSLRLFCNDKYTKFFITDVNVLKTLNTGASFTNPMIYPGDILAYSAGRDNHIQAVNKFFDIKAQTTNMGFGNLIQDNRVYGRVYSRNNAMLSILTENKDGFVPDPDDSSKRMYFPMPASIMVYETESGKCYMGSANDIITYTNDPQSCSKVLYIGNDGYAQQLIVYK